MIAFPVINMLLLIIGADYVSFNQNLTIPMGQSSVSLTITLKDDTIPEPTETFEIVFNLISGASVTIDPSFATSTVTITDSDSEFSI